MVFTKFLTIVLIAILGESIVYETISPTGFIYNYMHPETPPKPHKKKPPIIIPPPVTYWYADNYYEASFITAENDSFLQSRLWTRNNVNLRYKGNFVNNATTKWVTDLGSQYNTAINQPIVADIDQDGIVEILSVVDGVVAQHDWVYCFYGNNGSIKWISPDIPYLHPRRLTAYDIDQDGYIEILATAYSGTRNGIHVLNHNGTIRWENETEAMYSVACYDINDDGKIEILVNGESKFYCFSYDGGLEWSVPIPSSSVILVGDVNNDNMPEIVTNSYTTSPSRVYILDGNGGVLLNVSIPFANVVTPSMYDVNNDGLLEILFYSRLSATTNNVGLLSPNGTTLWTFTTNLQIDAHQTAMYDVNNDGEVEILIGCGELAGTATLFCLNSTGGLVWQYGPLSNLQFEPSVLVADINNDGSLEILIGVRNGYIHELKGDGSVLWIYRAGTFIMYNICMADIDGDDITEIIVNTMDGSYFRLACLTGV
jgi:hypothetical protein